MLLPLLYFPLAPLLKPPSWRVFPCAEVFAAGSVPAEVFAFVGRCALGRTCVCTCVGCDRTCCTTAQTQNRTLLLVLSGFVLLLLRELDGMYPGQHRDQTSRWGTSLAAPCASFLHHSTDFVLLRQRWLLDPAEE